MHSTSSTALSPGARLLAPFQFFDWRGNFALEGERIDIAGGRLQRRGTEGSKDDHGSKDGGNRTGLGCSDP